MPSPAAISWRCAADHPFFSYDDWAIAVTPCNAGIPQVVRNLTVTFRYNDIASVERLFERYPDGLAAVIMEPATTEEPRNGFLQKVRQLCRTHGTVFILDEMITGSGCICAVPKRCSM